MTSLLANLHVQNAVTMCRFCNAEYIPEHKNMPFGGQVEGP